MSNVIQGNQVIVEPTVNKIISTERLVWLVVMILTIIITVVLLILLGVLLLSPTKSTLQTALQKMFNIKQLTESVVSDPPDNVEEMMKGKGLLKGAVFPFQILANQRLIVYLQRSNSSYSNYYVYKFPIGTYTSLPDLVTALNTVNNYRAIYFDTKNSVWVINKGLIWSISSSGVLQFEWTNSFYDKFAILTSAPLANPAFHFSEGQGGINDVLNTPDVLSLPVRLGVIVNTLLIQNVIYQTT